MNKTIIALSLSLIAAPALATNTPGADCVGVNACKTNSDNRTTNTATKISVQLLPIRMGRILQCRQGLRQNRI